MQVIRREHFEWSMNALDEAANWVCLHCVVVSILPFHADTPICSSCHKELWTKTTILDGLSTGALITLSNTGLMYNESGILYASN